MATAPEFPIEYLKAIPMLVGRLNAFGTPESNRHVVNVLKDKGAISSDTDLHDCKVLWHYQTNTERKYWQFELLPRVKSRTTDDEGYQKAIHGLISTSGQLELVYKSLADPYHPRLPPAVRQVEQLAYPCTFTSPFGDTITLKKTHQDARFVLHIPEWDREGFVALLVVSSSYAYYKVTPHVYQLATHKLISSEGKKRNWGREYEDKCGRYYDNGLPIFVYDKARDDVGVFFACKALAECVYISPDAEARCPSSRTDLYHPSICNTYTAGHFGATWLQMRAYIDTGIDEILNDKTDIAELGRDTRWQAAHRRVSRK